jgi:hypothetical protein
LFRQFIPSGKLRLVCLHHGFAIAPGLAYVVHDAHDLAEPTGHFRLLS